MLSLGAMQWNLLGDMCPLSIAVCEGFVDVLRVLIYGGMRQVEDKIVFLCKALYMVILCRRAKIPHLLLTVDGEKTR